MDDLDKRLTQCFAAVFKDLPADQILAASTQTTSAWDSLAAVTLVGVVEEEFGIQINLLDLPELNSYLALKNYLEKELAVS